MNNLIKVFFSIGYPIRNSKSPSLHNVGYKALGVEDQFLYLRAEVKPEGLEAAVKGIRGFNFGGVSVTMPHKQEIMKYLDDIEETAQKIGAVNTVVNKDGVLIGYNTDWIGAIVALEKKVALAGKKAGVIGAGGAGRAIVFGLLKKGVQVKIFNRSIDKAKALSQEFGCEFAGLDSLNEISNMDIVVNATSVGMNQDVSPIDKEFLNNQQVVLDAVYLPKETRLLKEAKEKGAQIVYGYEMLLYQGVEQFKMYTGLDAPVKEMEAALLKNL